MSAVAAPDARHHHDDQHGVELEDEQSTRVPESAAKALPEAEEFGDVICAWIGAKARGCSGGSGSASNPGFPPSGTPSSREYLLRIKA